MIHATTTPATANNEICLVTNEREKQKAAAKAAWSLWSTASRVIPMRTKPKATVSPKNEPKYQLLELAKTSDKRSVKKKAQMDAQVRRHDKTKAATIS